MAINSTSYRVLGRVAPAASTTATLYTATNVSAVISTLSICNQSSSNSTYTIAVRPGAEVLSPKHYIAYNASIPAQDTVALTIGITLAATDVISVIAGNSSTSFNLFGSEITPILTLPTFIEYLVVAGGGGGSGANGGGGGAGGYRTATEFAITSGTPITVTVGAGGAENTAGVSSVFGSISTVGGGSGNGGAGGSGGGHGNAGGSGGTATAGQGNIGGAAPGGQSNGAGGGGGAGGAGFANSSGNGGAGGAGVYSSISGTSTAYAGGGGGGGGNVSGTTSGAGGLGGGGDGGYGASSATWNGIAGTANTGGGGGGGGGRSGVGNGNGLAGGSGIVIIRYPSTDLAATSTTGSPTITVAGGYRVYKFTSSGSITF